MEELSLEDHIMQCWAVVDDLNLVKTVAARGEDVQHLIDSLMCLYDVKFRELFSAYDQTLTVVSGETDTQLCEQVFHPMSEDRQLDLFDMPL